MKTYVKKPVKVQATQWFENGDHPLDFSVQIPGGPPVKNSEGRIVRYFRHPDVDGQLKCKHCGIIMNNHGWIDTLESGHVVCPGDFIITGVKGEMYPCKPDIFEQTYSSVNESPKITLIDFVSKLLNYNSSFRLWVKSKEKKYSHESVADHVDQISMTHQLISGESIFRDYSNREVLYITDILVDGNYPETINIVIQGDADLGVKERKYVSFKDKRKVLIKNK